MGVELHFENIRNGRLGLEIEQRIMAAQLRQPSPPGGIHPHHVPPGAHPQMNGHMPMQAHPKITPQHMTQLNEAVWLQIGTLYR